MDVVTEDAVAQVANHEEAAARAYALGLQGRFLDYCAQLALWRMIAAEPRTGRVRAHFGLDY